MRSHYIIVCAQVHDISALNESSLSCLRTIAATMLCAFVCLCVSVCESMCGQVGAVPQCVLGSSRTSIHHL